MEKKVIENNHNKTVLMEINDTSKMFREHLKKCGEKAGINSTYFRIMCAIDRYGSLSQVDLVNFTHLKAPTISLMLKNLEYDGIIKKEIDENDARSVKISFTEKGKEMSKQNMIYIRNKELDLEKVISDEEKEVLLRVLSKIQKEIGEQNENI